MITRVLLTWTALLMGALCTGCAATELRDANERLTSYYVAKEQAETTSDWRMLESSVASLQALSVEATEIARNEADPLNKISFYRIAATAAWQADDPTVVAIGQEGQALCQGDDFDRAPRDCGMLLVIPTMAGVDETTQRLNDLQERVDAVSYVATPEDAAMAEQIYRDYDMALDTLLAQRSRIQASGAHPQFKDAVDTNIGILFCDNLKGKVLGVLGLVDSSRLTEARIEISARECDLARSGVPRDDLRCVTADCD